MANAHNHAVPDVLDQIIDAFADRVAARIIARQHEQVKKAMDTDAYSCADHALSPTPYAAAMAQQQEAPVEPNAPDGERAKTAALEDQPAAPASPEEPTPPQPEPLPDLPLETVRAFFSDLNRNGYHDEIKSLIESFGASKLTDIPADKYPELMEKARLIA